MARQTDLHRHLTAATAVVRRELVLEWLTTLPRDTSMGTIIDAASHSEFADAFRALQVEQLGSNVSEPAGPSRPVVVEEVKEPERPRINTRTRGGRLALDTAVRDALITEGPSSIAGLASRVPGDETQVRQSIRRLIEGNEVVGRETDAEARYSVTADVAARTGGSTRIADAG